MSAIIAIILLVFTSVMAFLVLRNFGGGLKYHSAYRYISPKFYLGFLIYLMFLVNKPARSNSLRRAGTKFTHRKNQSFPLSANPNRMSIDWWIYFPYLSLFIYASCPCMIFRRLDSFFLFPLTSIHRSGLFFNCRLGLWVCILTDNAARHTLRNPPPPPPSPPSCEFISVC